MNRSDSPVEPAIFPDGLAVFIRREIMEKKQPVACFRLAGESL